METKENNESMGSALLIYMILMVLLITLAPFRFHWPSKIHFLWAYNPKDHIYNIFLFIPLGFLIRISTKNKHRFYWRELLFGGLLSLLIEITQSFIKGRTTTGHDIIANGLGALIGAFLCDHSASIMRENISTQVPIWQMPLMIIIFLLTPLTWLTHVSSDMQPAHLFLLLPLGIFGSGIIHSIYIERIDPTGKNPGRYIIFASIWFLIATFSAALQYFKQTTVIWVIMAGVIFLQFMFRDKTIRSDRRFEVKTLKRLMPIYLIYLLALMLWGTNHDSAGVAGAGFSKMDAKLSLVNAFHVVECFSAFTLFGYVIVQLRGRKKGSSVQSFLITILLSTLLIFLPAVINGKAEMTLPHLLINAFLLAGSLYGGLIYMLQVALIKKH
jgi:glycopeptide antibiotics resistance protein